MKTLCIYHGNCADGFGAAWAVWMALGNDVEFFPGIYQNPPPDVSGRDVIMVDFSYKRPVIDELAKSAKSILILDHHKSAAEDLAAFPCVPTAPESHLRGWRPDHGVYVTFDMDNSGAGLAWDHFHDAPRPPLIDYIEDRDLWRFALPKSREIAAVIFSHPYDFDLWTAINGELSDDYKFWNLVAQGEAIERKHRKDIAELVGVVTRKMNIGGYVVPMANLPYTLTSDAGHLLAEGYPFAGCYWDTPEGRVFSLRSRDDGADVSAIAKQYGGGGHKNASGFRIAFHQLGQFELPEVA